MNWDDVSDFEINKAVAETVGLSTDNGYGFIDSGDNVVCYDVISPVGGEPYAVEVRVNYCNSWADMGLLISESKISLIKWCEPEEGYEASIVTYYGHGSVNSDIFYSHTNPLRAAAIVFLMMNGVNPEDLI